MRLKQTLIALLLCSIFCTGCPKQSDADRAKSVAKSIGTTLAFYPALIDSLVASGAIKPELKETYLKDFKDLLGASGTLAGSIAGCIDKLCYLAATDAFQSVFFDVVNRGNLGKVEKLARVQSVLGSIIAVARILFGESGSSRSIASPEEAEKDLKRLIKELEAEVKQ